MPGDTAHGSKPSIPQGLLQGVALVCLEVAESHVRVVEDFPNVYGQRLDNGGFLFGLLEVFSLQSGECPLFALTADIEKRVCRALCDTLPVSRHGVGGIPAAQHADAVNE